MSTKAYVLVPGAWHDRRCWEPIVRSLEGAGHIAIAPDLPGCSPATSENRPVTLASWVDALCDVVEPLRDSIVLLGHSRGGIVISEVAERLPHRITELVYVSAFMLRAGESVLRVLREESDSPFLREVSLSHDRRHWELNREAARELFYGDCSEADARAAIERLIAEPVAPMMTPVRLSEERFGRVPRTYIECARDTALPLELQRKMQSRWPCQRVVTLDSGHAPFLSMPDELTKCLFEDSSPRRKPGPI